MTRNLDRRSPFARIAARAGARIGASLVRLSRAADGRDRALACVALAALVFVFATEEYWTAGGLVALFLAGLAGALFALTRRAAFSLGVVVTLMAMTFTPRLSNSGFSFDAAPNSVVHTGV